MRIKLHKTEITIGRCKLPEFTSPYGTFVTVKNTSLTNIRLIPTATEAQFIAACYFQHMFRL